MSEKYLREYTKQELQAILDETPSIDPSLPIDSPISDFFRGKNVLLTGPTGFLGHLYLEKLLRINVNRVYAVMRSKRNRTSYERLNRICDGPVFKHLREIQPNFMDRITIVDGNLEMSCVGINDKQMINELKENVNVVIHAAADVRFNEPLYDLLRCNLYGTRELLELSKQMKSLNVFVYVSTAFSNCTHSKNENIEEKFYTPPMDVDTLLHYVEQRKSDFDWEFLNIISPNLIKPWPNNYTFSKALSESIVQRYGKILPIAVIRPTIIISTYADPIPAWSNSYGGMNGVTVGIGSGLLRNLYWKNIQLNIVCADFVTNGSLAIAWHTANEYQKCNSYDTKIYHINRYSDPTLYFDETVRYLLKSANIVCPMNCVWYPVCQKTYFQLHDDILTLLYQVIPSMIMDVFYKSSKLKLVPLQRKIIAMSEVIKFFNHNNFNFANKNLENVLSRMTEYDRQYFLCDPSVVNWRKYYLTLALGGRVYLIHDPFENYDSARALMKWRKMAHLLVKYLFIGLLGSVIYYILRFLTKKILL